MIPPGGGQKRHYYFVETLAYKNHAKLTPTRTALPIYHYKNNLFFISTHPTTCKTWEASWQLSCPCHPRPSFWTATWERARRPWRAVSCVPPRPIPTSSLHRPRIYCPMSIVPSRRTMLLLLLLLLLPSTTWTCTVWRKRKPPSKCATC